MRIRSIKPEFFSSPSTSKCSFPARLLYIAMWTLADDWGVGEANAKQLAAYAFPMDEISSKEIPCLVKEIENNFETVFFTNSGREYFQILNWDEHQVTQRRAKRRHPTFDDEFSQVNHCVEELPSVDKEFPCLVKENASTEQGNRGTEEQGNRGTGGFEVTNVTSHPLHTSAKTEDVPNAKKRHYSDEFETFWSIFPIKRGKPKAYEAFKNAMQRADLETILAGAQAYAHWLAANPDRSGKWAQGWLNDDRWEDDLTTDQQKPRLTRSEQAWMRDMQQANEREQAQRLQIGGGGL